MADKAIIKTETLTGIGDALRGAGIAEADKLLSPDEMKQRLQGVAKRSASDLTASGAKVTVPQGYYPAAMSMSVTTTGLGTPVISVDGNGKITAKVTHTLSGWVEADSKTGTKQLTTQAGKTVTPTTQEQTAVAAGTYVTGDIKVAAAAAGGEIIESVAVDSATGTFTVTTKKTVTSIERMMLTFLNVVQFVLADGWEGYVNCTFKYGDEKRATTLGLTISGNTISFRSAMLASMVGSGDFVFGAIWYT